MDPQSDIRRRCAILNLPPELLVLMLTTGNWFKLTADVPADAEFVAATANFEQQAIQVLVRSKEYPETPLGQAFPAVGLISIHYRAEVGDGSPD